MSDFKVLFLVNAWPSTEEPGNGVFVEEQITSLGNAGVDYEVLRVGMGGGWRAYLKDIRRVREAGKSYSLIHAQHMFCGFLAILSGWRSKTIVSFMSSGSRNYRGSIFLLGHIIFHIVASLSLGNIFKNYVPKIYSRKSIYIPNGVDTSLFVTIDRKICRERLGFPESAKILLFVCSGGVNKKRKSVKRYDLYNEILFRLIDLDDNWQPLLMTHVPRREAPYYYNCADALLLTSDFEGSPNAVKEALACGLPVVSRDVGDVALQISGLPGCQILGPQCIEDAVVFLSNIPSVNKEDNRLDWLKKRCSLEDVALKIIEFYKDRLGYDFLCFSGSKRPSVQNS